jgi:hypothetical protein
MMKRIVILAAMALTIFVGTNQAHDPFPECKPCPFVR